MTSDTLRQRGFDIFILPDLADIQAHRTRLEQSGVEYEFHELTEEILGVRVHILGAKRITLSLKKQLASTA